MTLKKTHVSGGNRKMAPGILAQLCLLILIILYWAGWLETDWPRKWAYGLAVTAWWLTSRPPLAMKEAWWIHPGAVVLLIGLVITLGRLCLSRATVTISFGLFSGTALFLWHEFARVATDWADPLFRLVCVAVFVAVGGLFSRSVKEHVACLLCGSMMLHVWIASFHREMLMPLIWGPGEFLDTVWLSLLVMLGWRRLRVFAANIHEKWMRIPLRKEE